MKNQSKYCIVDDRGVVIKRGFKSESTAVTFIKHYRLNKYDKLKVVKDVKVSG